MDVAELKMVRASSRKVTMGRSRADYERRRAALQHASHGPSDSARSKPHHAVRAEVRTRLATHSVDSQADLPSISMGGAGKGSRPRKPSISHALSCSEQGYQSQLDLCTGVDIQDLDISGDSTDDSCGMGNATLESDSAEEHGGNLQAGETELQGLECEAAEEAERADVAEAGWELLTPVACIPMEAKQLSSSESDHDIQQWALLQ
mmetsp:Transcript_55728/g.120424  ORF Transcript_55728/g.120424 Transcript_55728/m.120424 type:complete len:206 (+) Transcript_55728:59-676(+)|eukprot:CAMPEP_0170608102 /NCGR_PEP_ID=MMETSP0224-20130122/21407_1 /TAXON_ID=285029 /ORGANISM="Togula jolla, Strain CCCM 725" /LENGTH=205 /DNA_ID=CAMNT_0010933309 /DNA_START=49 /DNA_END=666 /DNA_ORIENTATION=-